MDRPKQPPRHRESERGTILVVAVILVTLTLVIVADARNVARIEWEAATNADVDFILEVALQGGLQLAEAYLRQDLQDSPDVDHFQEEWAGSEGIQKDLNPEAYGESGYQEAGAYASEEEAQIPRLRIFIEDEDRKFPLPLLTKGAESLKDRRKEQFTELIQSFRENTKFDVDQGIAANYADQIIAFITRDENDSSFGPVPRPATKSGMIMNVTDLALIPGIPETLMFDQVDEETGDIARGLMHFVTIWTDMAVNINTASEAVLRACMRPGDASVGSDIFTKRGEIGQDYLTQEQENISRYGEDPRRPGRALRPTTGTESEPDPSSEEEEEKGYWEDVQDLKDDIKTVTETVLNDIRPYTTVTSKVFTIWVEAHMNEVRRVRRYVVRREGARMVLIKTELVSYPRFRLQTTDEIDMEQGEYDR